MLRWMIFTGACTFAAVLLWRYHLIRLMVESDRTYISSFIAVLYVGTSLHCLWRTVVISREGDAARRAAQAIAAGEVNVADSATTLPVGLVTDHICDLVLKARKQGRGRSTKPSSYDHLPTGSAVRTGSAPSPAILR